MPQRFTYVLYINATPEATWRALTAPEVTRQYWGGMQAESTWQTGSALTIRQPQGESVRVIEGKVLEADKPRRLSFTGIGGAPDAIVTFTIRPVSDREIRLELDHSGYSEQAGKFVPEAWFAILSSLKTLLETGTALDHSWWRG